MLYFMTFMLKKVCKPQRNAQLAVFLHNLRMCFVIAHKPLWTIYRRVHVRFSANIVFCTTGFLNEPSIYLN